MKMQVQSLALLSGLKIWHCYKMQYRSQMWLGMAFLWCRPAAAALILSLTWEQNMSQVWLLKKRKKEKKKKKEFHLLKDRSYAL